ncbi:Metallo-beta-lactamase superfamily protein [Singulisphaera sp. GP187]|uniref:ComEC/Rec2 family competence protein n=1 Tax=Singulisphaera sp. GP187 TaxID=1882752 RepID=UPI000927C2FB|nr:MBL fold metallo-hydrolase [Singulisphaera sp. GP187]SIN89923.1 Metallo-beta-lactamase superfamily protein [Singulisphaera sp. GP187]
MRPWLRNIGAALAVGLLLGADQPPGNLDIYFIDMQGGAATLVVTPDRESILLDSGWRGFEDRDPKRIEHVLKDVAKLDHLNHLMTTHWHADHFGGVEGLVKRVRIDQFWDRGLPDPNAPDNDKAAYPDGPKPNDPAGVAYLKASSGRRKSLKAGDTVPLKGNVSMLVLASGGQVIQTPTEPVNPLSASAPADLDVDPSDNARSLAFRIRMGQFDFLDCGDLTWNVEKALVCPVDRVGPIDLYQVTHHGLSISNHPTLLKTIAPTVTIMNNGPKKGGDAATVRRLKSIPSIQAAYQLHKNAATSADDNTDPALIANSDPAGGQFIHVHVTPDGRKFSVQFGEDGPTRTFDSR